MSNAWGRLGSACALAGLACVPVLAQQPNSICHQASVPLQPTSFLDVPIELPRFDPALGILSGIEFTLAGTIVGDMGIENLDALASTITTTFQAFLGLARPDGSLILGTAPVLVLVDDLGPFDGIVDFAGTSGISRQDLEASAVEVQGTPPPTSDLIDFQGPPGAPGSITLRLSGLGNTIANGPGNLIAQFSTSAGAEISVCYLYQEDCNQNGIPDHEETADGSSDDCNQNGVPDECEREPGFAYCFGLLCPCGNPDPAAGCANSSGQGGRLDASGSASVSADDLLFLGTGLVTGRTAVLFSADQSLNACLGRAFGDGLRCAGVHSIRVGAEIVGRDSSASFGPGILAGDLYALPGVERRYQLWYRDPSGPCGQGFNLTNGFSVFLLP
jgi:hypothetical protein